MPSCRQPRATSSRRKLDLRYGPGPKETLDLFVPAGRRAGTFVFIHGGYWRALDKDDFSFVAGPFVAQGIAVAVVELRPVSRRVDRRRSSSECRRAVAWIVARRARRTAPIRDRSSSAAARPAAISRR